MVVEQTPTHRLSSQIVRAYCQQKKPEFRRFSGKIQYKLRSQQNRLCLKVSYIALAHGQAREMVC